MHHRNVIIMHKIIFGTEDGIICFWNGYQDMAGTTSSKNKISAHYRTIESIVLSKDRSLMITCDCYEIKIWNMVTREICNILYSKTIIKNIYLSPDHKYIVSIHGCNKMNVWSVKKGTHKIINTYALVNNVIITNKFIITSEEDKICFYNNEDHTLNKTVCLYTKINIMKLFDQKIIVGFDNGLILIISDYNTCNEDNIYIDNELWQAYNDGIYLLDIIHKHIITYGESYFKIWDLQGDLVNEFYYDIDYLFVGSSTLSVIDDQSFVTCGDSYVIVWNLHTGSQIKKLYYGPYVTAVA